MSEDAKTVKVVSRDSPFAERPATRIWQEIPAPGNPYMTAQALCHGYDLFELVEKRSFIDVLYLLFRGELPNREEAALLERLMIGLINPGPRHPATRAVMSAGASKTDPVHLLPIALNVYGGEHLGAAEVEPAMAFLRKQRRQDPRDVITELLVSHTAPEQGDWHIVPGFGSLYGAADPISARLAEQLLSLPGETSTLEWGQRFATLLNERKMGWLAPGLAAAVLTDLGFTPRAGAGLFQLFAAPGLLAHGAEMANKPVTAMPFIKDENYVIDYEK